MLFLSFVQQSRKILPPSCSNLIGLDQKQKVSIPILDEIDPLNLTTVELFYGFIHGLGSFLPLAVCISSAISFRCPLLFFPKKRD
jgi:hypothetical protein